MVKSPTEVLGEGLEPLKKALQYSTEQPPDQRRHILLIGESGAGKSTLANYFMASVRWAKKQITKHCGELNSDSLVRSELHCHEKGAFTDAANKKIAAVLVMSMGLPPPTPTSNWAQTPPCGLHTICHDFVFGIGLHPVKERKLDLCCLQGFFR